LASYVGSVTISSHVVCTWVSFIKRVVGCSRSNGDWLLLMW